MHASTLALGFLLTYGINVFAFDTIIFSSVTQCGSFNISFGGSQAPPTLPLTLTVIPFNSTNPISITIPREAWNTETSTGAAINFLPFAAGIEFLASLDDANGQGTGKVSDVIKIQPSDDAGCLPAGGSIMYPTPPFTLVGSLSQCEPFALFFNATSNTPTVRIFRPKWPSFFINSTRESPGMATFVTEIKRGKEIVMLFDDSGNRQTTDLITVGGDSSSSMDCIKQFSKNDSSKQDGLPKSAIFGIVAASGSIVGSIALLMGLYLCRRKRLRETQQNNPKTMPPTNLRPTFKTPRYVSGITLFGTTGVVTPTSPSGFNHRASRVGERDSWIQLGRPAWFSAFELNTRDAHRSQSSHNIITHPTELHDFNVDLIPDMVTISSSHRHVNTHENTPAAVFSARGHGHDDSRSRRATPDVPVAAGPISTFYHSSAGFDDTHSQRSSHTVSTTESGRRIIMEPFVVGEMDINLEAPSSFQTPTATRLQRSVAWRWPGTEARK